MKVYLVFRYGYEGQELCGVYSSLDLAVQNGQRSKMYIEERTLDSSQPAKTYYSKDVKFSNPDDLCETTYVYTRQNEVKQ